MPTLNVSIPRVSLPQDPSPEGSLSQRAGDSLLGGRILPWRFGGKERGPLGSRQQGRSLVEWQLCTESAAAFQEERGERNQFKGWCQCQEAHSFSKGHKDCFYLSMPLALKSSWCRFPSLWITHSTAWKCVVSSAGCLEHRSWPQNLSWHCPVEPGTPRTS